jgi:ribosomal protein S18 acetylase RimI-like enzyme
MLGGIMLIEIVRASEKYAESFCKALDCVARERKYLATVTGFPLESVKGFVNMIVSNNYAQYYAIDGDKVVGWCDITPKNNEGFTHVGVLGMGILSEYRNQGIGSKLIDKAIEHSVKNNGIEKIELEVFESNVNAIKLYEKFGFVYEGKKMRSRKLDGVYENLVMMGKEVLS